MILFDIVSESFHRSPLSVAAVVPLAQQMAKRTIRFLTKSRNTKARHQSQSLLAKEFARCLQRDIKKELTVDLSSRKNQSDVKGQENPGKASAEVTDPGASDLEGYYWMSGKEQQNASSTSGRNEQCPSIGRPIAVHADRR